jgi:hypothetical protein
MRLTDSGTAPLLNVKDLADSDNSVVDSDESTDDDKEENVIISDQDDDSDSDGASVSTEVCVGET